MEINMRMRKIMLDITINLQQILMLQLHNKIRDLKRINPHLQVGFVHSVAKVYASVEIDIFLYYEQL